MLKKLAEQKSILNAVNLISNKINERFKNLKSAFRYFDQGHKAEIGLN